MITMNQELLKAVYADMRAHQGLLTPAPNWSMDHFFPGLGRTPTFEEMMTTWVGAKMLKAANSPEVVDSFVPFIKGIDDLNMLPGVLHDRLGRVCDLGTVIDMNMIFNYYQAQPGEGVKWVLEIGGGYGRLAEALLKMFDGYAKYVMIDAVPESMVYAYQYLSQAFPDKKVGLFQPDKHQAFEDYDCIIVPTWHFEKANSLTYDIGVSVSSMQEMSQEQIDYFIRLLDMVVRTDGTVYMFNSRDYFKRKFEYPNTWELMYKEHTPKSWSPDFPAEVFRVIDLEDWSYNKSVGDDYDDGLLMRYRDAYWLRFDQAHRRGLRLQELKQKPLNRLLGRLTR